MTRLYRRRDRIKEKVQITHVLSFYGYRVHPESVEQQFPCDLHGDGLDQKPSARVYPHTNAWYCFGCSKSRDSISTVMEKEAVSFPEAISILEKRYGLPQLPWDDEEVRQREKTSTEEFDEFFERGNILFEKEKSRTESILNMITQERQFPMDKILALWEMFDKINYEVSDGALIKEEGIESLAKIRIRVMKKIGESNGSKD